MQEQPFSLQPRCAQLPLSAATLSCDKQAIYSFQNNKIMMPDRRHLILKSQEGGAWRHMIGLFPPREEDCLIYFSLFARYSRIVWQIICCMSFCVPMLISSHTNEPRVACHFPVKPLTSCCNWAPKYSAVSRQTYSAGCPRSLLFHCSARSDLANVSKKSRLLTRFISS